MAEHSENYFGNAYSDYLSRIRPPKEIQLAQYFQVMDTSLHFGEMERYLSIGPGMGTVDRAILKSFPKCTTFIGIEPRLECIPVIQHNIKQHQPNISCQLIPSCVEDYKGPDEPVDFVLMCHLLYDDIPDRKALIAQSLTWLKSGGLMVIAHAKMSSWREKFCVGNIFADSVKKDLQNLGLNIINEHVQLLTIDIRKKDKAFVNFCMRKSCTDEEAREFFKNLDAFEPSGILEESTTIFVIQKP